MKKTITYLGIEKVVYEFDLIDIRKALSKYFNIEPSNDYEFDVYEQFDNTPTGASLIIKYSTPTARTKYNQNSESSSSSSESIMS